MEVIGINGRTRKGGNTASPMIEEIFTLQITVGADNSQVIGYIFGGQLDVVHKSL